MIVRTLDEITHTARDVRGDGTAFLSICHRETRITECGPSFRSNAHPERMRQDAHMHPTLNRASEWPLGSHRSGIAFCP